MADEGDVGMVNMDISLGSEQPSASKKSKLEAILSEEDASAFEDASSAHASNGANGMADDGPLSAVPEGMCIECEDQPEMLRCDQCGDSFCEVCFLAQHRRGNRATHTATVLTDPAAPKVTLLSLHEKLSGQGPGAAAAGVRQAAAMATETAAPEVDADVGAEAAAAAEADVEAALQKQSGSNSSSHSSSWFTDRSKYIPMRLTLEERKKLRLLEAALNVSEYTDNVDILSYQSKTRRVHAQIHDMCAIMSGLVVASDYKEGQRLIKDRSYPDNEPFFQEVFEIGRRHKVLNPDKMRAEYGKLCYLLMDSQSATIQDLLDFRCVKLLNTVHAFLAARGVEAMLDDPLVDVATMEVLPRGRTRPEINRQIKMKERAIETLARKYSSECRRAGSSATEEDVRHALYSIGDNHSYLTFNRDPIDRVIHYLKHYFRPGDADAGHSLAISGGRDGARLTHSHDRQYHYVLQSLTLWREIMHDMFRLWTLAEKDMLDENNPYRLCDTGQGLNRLQSAPRIGKAMRTIIHHVQTNVGSWVGSSVVHLGDKNVPNALFFIEKYAMVPRILAPLAIVVDGVAELAKDPQLAAYLDSTFGGVEACRREILLDFFRHAFDGSGADNFFSAGSCIDGRLTSAFNWCGELHKKRYYPVFKLAGFNSFDGDFK